MYNSNLCSTAWCLYFFYRCFFDKTTSSSSLCLSSFSWKPSSSDSASASSGLCYSSSCTCFPFSDIYSCNISPRGTPTPNPFSQYSCTNPSASSSLTPAYFTPYSGHGPSSTETAPSWSDAEDGSSEKEDDAASNVCFMFVCFFKDDHSVFFFLLFLLGFKTKNL